MTTTSTLKITTSMLLFAITVNVYASIEQSVTLPLTFEYESNPLFSASDEQSISRVILTPNYSIRANQGTEQWFVIASLRLEQSSDQTISQNRNDPSINLGWIHDYEMGQFGVTALLNDQSTRVREFTDSGLLSNDNTRKTRSLSVNWLNNLSDRTSLSLNGAVSNVMFEGQNTTGLINYRNESIDATLNYTLSEQMEIFTQLFFSRYKPEDVNSLNSETSGFNLGFTWNVNEKFNITASAGTNEIKSTSNNNSWQAMLNMQYATLRSNSHFILSRSQSPASTGNINESNQIAAGWSYSLSDKEEIAFDTSWAQNLSLNKTETKSLTVNYTQHISLSWDFSLSVTHRNRDDELFSVSSNGAMASIIYNIPEF